MVLAGQVLAACLHNRPTSSPSDFSTNLDLNHSPRSQRHYYLPKRRFVPTILHGVKSLKTIMWSLLWFSQSDDTAVRQWIYCSSMRLVLHLSDSPGSWSAIRRYAIVCQQPADIYSIISSTVSKVFMQFVNMQQSSNFMFKPCIDMTSLNNNQLMHSQFNIY